MATYLELYGLRHNDVVSHKVIVATTIAAEAIRTEGAGTANHANRLVWAKDAFADPIEVGKRALWAVLASNSANTVAQITGATDAQVQTAVDAVVDVLAGS